MTITVTDPVLLAELKHIEGSVILTDPQGRLIGTLLVNRDGKVPPGIKSPITDFESAGVSTNK